MNLKHTYITIAALFTSSFSLMSCEKEDEMVVDRVVSPVLVITNGSTFLPSEAVTITATFYELNKSGILNNAVGIDSIPVANLAVKVMLSNSAIAELTTDAAGKVTLSKSWVDLGLTAPIAGNAVNLGWSGNYKNQAFTKISRVQVK